MVSLAFTAGELLAFGFTDDLVDRIMRFLETSATDLTGSKPDGVGSTDFSAGPASLACATDAGKAHQHVIEAINDMVKGLHTYRTSIGDMRRMAWALDDTIDTDITTLIFRAEDCAASPTVGAPSSCGVDQ